MLVHVEKTQPIFIVGTSVYADDLIEMIGEEHTGGLIKISKQEYFDLPDWSQCIIGFMNMQYRKNFLLESTGLKRIWPSYWHASSYVSKSSKIGQGVIVMPLVFVGSQVEINDFCDIGTGASIGHGSRIGKNCVFSPNVTLGGSVVFGENVYVGMASTVRDKISVCDNTNFHMTSVVTKSILEPNTYFGNRKVVVDTSI